MFKFIGKFIVKLPSVTDLNFGELHTITEHTLTKHTHLHLHIFTHTHTHNSNHLEPLDKNKKAAAPSSL